MIEAATPSVGMIIDNMNYAHEHGADRPELADWVWPL